jgi:hypothetical protein
VVVQSSLSDSGSGGWETNARARLQLLGSRLFLSQPVAFTMLEHARFLIMYRRPLHLLSRRPDHMLKRHAAIDAS